MRIETNLNDRPCQLEVDPDETLLAMLRRIGLTGTHFGCGTGECGACVVLLDGRPINSCLLPAWRIQGRRVTTIEGVGTHGEPHPVQRHFVESGAIQCGYSTPGSILSAVALLSENPDPSEEEIRSALDGNLCRCTGYSKKIEAIRRAAGEMRGDSRD